MEFVREFVLIVTPKLSASADNYGGDKKVIGVTLLTKKDKAI